MSSIVRHELETFIKTTQNIMMRIIRDRVADAVRDRNYELSSMLEDFMSFINTCTPSKFSYTAPSEYVDALRSYALALSITSEMINELGITPEIIEVSKQILNLPKVGLPVGKVAGDTKNILMSLGDKGNKVFIDGCRKYINVLIGKVKELDPQELQIVKETVLGLFTASSRPCMRISDLARVLGTREKDLKGIIKKLVEKDPNMVLVGELFAFKDLMKDYLEKRIGESSFLLINDLAKEWNVKRGVVLGILSKISDIYPGLMVFEDRVASTIRDLSHYISRKLNELKVLTTKTLAMHIGVEPKVASNILKKISGHIPEVIMADTEIIAHGKLAMDWLREIFAERPKVFIDEIAGKIGASTKNTKKLIEELSRLYSGEVLLEKNEVIYTPNLGRGLMSEIKTGKRSREIEEVITKHPEAMEAQVFENIYKILKEFEERISRR